MKIVVIASGGLDSTVLLWKLREEGHDVEALGVNYRQRHKRELEHLEGLCSRYGFEHSIADLTGLAPVIMGRSSQLNRAVKVPHGHYAAESMKATVVPNRNMILLAVAIGRAVAQRAEAVAYGAHAGDHAIYPDCRPAFADAMSWAAALCDWQPVALLRPFVELTKADIVQMGAELGVPMDETWSCYEGRELHCGQCGTCVERREAFELAGIVDPTEYRS